ncbi:lysozyme inhibitor LprI family protein [Cognatiyoonia sp. IB215182]|uniref:lysozyme inhibitor LprI family protein n=1 Tax=Cognatiyoonia sp. IB215182 TaxID=3097353 RepID=UPI002A0B4C8C|nr:lysozyme inhibitor LprI family protein [Cognatiyoonia sp. IB215182]MDX8352354.1 lysozyme inhibitor LprI family protein [Cognatiyoonia sp. IB215182]
MKSLIVVMSLSACSFAHAQGTDTLTVDTAAVRECHATTPIGAIYPDCLGQASDRCQLQDGGGTTLGIATCISAETAVWDAILNEEYQALRAAFEGQDGGVGGATSDELLIALRDAQRAWIAFRDADCGLRYTLYQGGTIRSIVAANCHMTTTARRALALRDMRAP